MRKRSRFSLAARTNDCEGMITPLASVKQTKSQQKRSGERPQSRLPGSARLSVTKFPGAEIIGVSRSWSSPVEMDGRKEGVLAFNSFRCASSYTGLLVVGWERLAWSTLDGSVLVPNPVISAKRKPQQGSSHPKDVGSCRRVNL